MFKEHVTKVTPTNTFSKRIVKNRSGNAKMINAFKEMLHVYRGNRMCDDPVAHHRRDSYISKWRVPLNKPIGLPYNYNETDYLIAEIVVQWCNHRHCFAEEKYANL